MHSATPFISIIMPVYQTGMILLDSVRSVVNQTWFENEGAVRWELLVIDDGSADAETQHALRQAAALSPNVRVVANARSKGVAGARNTGIDAARGDFIGFLDSDDLWYPDFLSRQAAAFADLPNARWRSAHFHKGDQHAVPVQAPLHQRSPYLYSRIAGDYLNGKVSRLDRPVKDLLRGGCIQVMGVQIERRLLLACGGFNERLRCAEDYDLWLRLACVENLYIAPIDAGIYRIRPGSLSRSNRPMYFDEDRMLVGLKRETAFKEFQEDLDLRLQTVYSKFCFDYRSSKRFAQSAAYALKLVRMKPLERTGWKHLVATALLR